MRLRFLMLLLEMVLLAPTFAQAPSDAELKALKNRVILLYQTGKYTEAIPLAERYAAQTRPLFDENAREYAMALNNLAELLKATNRLDEAEPLYRRALAIDEASFGKDHPTVAADLNNLAELLKATNRLDEAEPLYRRKLAIDEASLGKDHPAVAVELNDLAELGVRFRAFDVGFELYWAEAFPETPAPFLNHRWLKRLTDTTAAGAGDMATTIVAEGLQHVLASVPFVGLAVGRLGKIALERSDYTRSASMLRAAAEQGLPQAQRALSRLFESGQGVSKSYFDAYVWLLMSYDAGFGGPRTDLQALEAQLSSTQLEQAKNKTRELEGSMTRSAVAHGCTGWRGEFDIIPTSPPPDLQRFCR